MALASTMQLVVLQLRGDHQAVVQRWQLASRRCAQHGFAYYRAVIDLLGGVSAAIEGGDWKERIGGITRAWQELRATGAGLAATRLGSLVALAHARAGSEEEAFRLLQEARERVAASRERFWEPELYRMLGELLLQAGVVPAEVAQAWQLPTRLGPCVEACFLRALQTAQDMGARLLELRAALALARWWQVNGKAREAQRLVLQHRRWFTEGSDTRDLIAAGQLLAELEAELGPTAAPPSAVEGGAPPLCC
jgi:hypothetical protein